MGIQTPGGSAEYQAAQTLLVNYCADCHNFHTQSEEQLIASNHISPGDPEGSSLFYRLKNSSGPLTPKNMPPTGTLSEEELQVIFDWIDNIE